jgi:hypothetical protein
MNKDRVAWLLEKVRDEDITVEEAGELDAVLEQKDDDSEWLMDEMEFAGMISLALDETSPDDFVRGLTERITAEQSGGLFTRDTQSALEVHKKFEVSEEYAAKRRKVAGLDPRMRSRRSPWPSVGILMCLIVGLLVVTRFAYFVPRSSAKLKVEEGSAQIIRGGVTEQVVGSRELAFGDRFNAQGPFVLVYADGTRITGLSDETAIIFEPGSAEFRGVAVSPVRKIFIQNGKIEVESSTRLMPILISSPHVEARLAGGRATIEADLATTRVEVQAGKIDLVESWDGRSETVTPATPYAFRSSLQP